LRQVVAAMSKASSNDSSREHSSSTSSSSSSSRRDKESSNVVRSLAASRTYFSDLKEKDYMYHKKQVHTVAWNCSGNKLGSGSQDETIRIWSLDRRGKCSSEVELKGHTDSVEQLAFHPSSENVLVTASADKTVKLWDTRSGKESGSVDTKGQNINVTWSPDGQHIAVGNKKDVVTIVDPTTFKVSASHQFTFEVNELRWSPSGEFICLTTGNGTVEIYSFPSFKKVTHLEAHTGKCYCLDFDPTHKYLATGGGDALVTIWDLQEMVCMRNLPRLDSLIRTLSFSHDGQYLASASEDLRIDISDVESGENVHTITTRAEVNSIAWNPKNLLLAYAGDEREGKFANSVNVFGYPQREKSSSSK